MIPKTKKELDILAGEYALGLLEAAEASEVRAALATNAELRAAVIFWEQHFYPLTAVVPDCDPPPRVWAAISAELDRAEPTPNLAPLFKNWAVKSWSAAVLAALAAGLLLYFAFKPDHMAPSLIAALHSPKDEKISWIATVDTKGLMVRAVAQETPPNDRSFQLWIIPNGPSQPPRSIGVLPVRGVFNTSALSEEIGPGSTLAISVEPLGGSPSGQPTGPVVFLGGVTQL